MKEYRISPKEAGQKMTKFLFKILKEAPAGFCYKMLRKKNITLNGKKATGNESLKAGDVVTFYLADDTFEKFAGKQQLNIQQNLEQVGVTQTNIKTTKSKKLKMDIIYEDDNILLYNKPVGILSQKSKDSDFSVNDYFLSYLLTSGQISAEELQIFKPSICNRLDRNTSGIIICGKTFLGLQKMNQMLKERTIGKYYRCIVLGHVKEAFTLHGFLHKDESTNKVTVKTEAFEEASEISTEFLPICNSTTELSGMKIDISLLEVHLITGKTHQIRAHLASIHHPIVGDYKYGNKKKNDLFKEAYGIKSQLLHAYRLQFGQITDETLTSEQETAFTDKSAVSISTNLSYLSNKEFIAPTPQIFKQILEGDREWQPGVQEV